MSHFRTTLTGWSLTVSHFLLGVKPHIRSRIFLIFFDSFRHTPNIINVYKGFITAISFPPHLTYF